MPTTVTPVDNVSDITTTWDSSTALNTTLDLDVTGMATAIIHTVKTGTITQGSAGFYVSPDGANWYPQEARYISWPALDGNVSLIGAGLVYILDVAGMRAVRLKLDEVILGAGSSALTLIATSAPTALGQATVFGDATAHLPDSFSPPVKIGGRAHSFADTTADENNRIDAWFDLDGRFVTGSDDGAHVTIGSTTDAEASADGSVIGLLKRLRTLLSTLTGAVTEDAPVSDTASSGLNGRLQRIAQRLTSIIALLPSALVGGRFDVNNGAWLGSTAPTVGQKTMANSVPTVLASDQASIPVAATLQASTNTNEVVGDVAHDSPVGGNPVLTGLEARTTDGTAVASGDVVRAIATILGKLIVKVDSIPELTWQYAAAAGGLVTTGGVTAKAAAGSGIRNYVKSCDVTNSHLTIGTEIVIRDGAGGTVLWRCWAGRDGGGISKTFDPPLRGTGNTLIEIAEVTTTATTGVLVNLQGYTAAE